MSIRATTILRSAALLGVAVAALVIAPAVAMAQAPRPGSPRPDFPGAKQGNTNTQGQTAKTPRSMQQK